MSSILKALRKLEEEKRGGKLEAPDLRVDQGQPAAVGKSFLPLIVGVVLGALIVGLLFFLPTVSTRKPDVVQSEPPTAATPESAPAVDSQQVVTDPPPLQETAKNTQITSTLAKPESPVLPGVNEPVAPSTQSLSYQGLNECLLLLRLLHSQPHRSRLLSKRMILPEPLPDGINLVVTEIFYQDAVNSMAVVNDLPVMVGSHVDSAVVSEISADQVLFEIDGKVFVVLVSQP